MLQLLREHGEKLKADFNGPLNDTVAMRRRGARWVAHVARPPNPALIQCPGERNLCHVQRKLFGRDIRERPAVDIGAAEIDVVAPAGCHDERGFDLVSMGSKVEALDVLDNGRGRRPPLKNANLDAGLVPDLEGGDVED